MKKIHFLSLTEVASKKKVYKEHRIVCRILFGCWDDNLKKERGNVTPLQQMLVELIEGSREKKFCPRLFNCQRDVFS